MYYLLGTILVYAMKISPRESILMIILNDNVLPGELGVGGRHLELLAPDAVEDVLEVVPVGHPHVDLLALEVDDAVLAAVLEAVLVGGDGVVGQELGEPVGAPGVHQVRQELDVLRSELLLVLHVDVGEVPLADLPGQGVELGVEVRDDGEDAGQLVVHEVVVVLAVVEGVQGQSVEESALVLGLTDDEGNLRVIFLIKIFSIFSISTLAKFPLTSVFSGVSGRTVPSTLGANQRGNDQNI